MPDLRWIKPARAALSMQPAPSRFRQLDFLGLSYDGECARRRVLRGPRALAALPGPYFGSSFDGVGGIGDPVQPGGFLGEHGRRFAPGHPVSTVVDLLHERHAGSFKFGEGAVLVAEVGVLGTMSALASFTLRPRLWWQDPLAGGSALWVIAGNYRATALYERAGWIIQARRHVDFTTTELERRRFDGEWRNECGPWNLDAPSQGRQEIAIRAMYLRQLTRDSPGLSSRPARCRVRGTRNTTANRWPG